MIDLEAQFADFLDKKFFWEPTADPDMSENREVMQIRRAQKKFANGAENIVPGRIAASECVEAVRPMKVKINYRSKVIEPILKAISKAYNVSIDDLLGKSTSPKFAKAKQHLCWAMFKYIPRMSLIEAGNILSKNHSTVLHGKKCFQAEQDFNKIAEVDKLMGIA